MKILRLLCSFLALAAAASLFGASDLAGRWTSKFDSQIGEQNYVFVFAHEGDHLTGASHYENSFGTGDVKLSNIKVEADRVSFTETLNIGGNELVVTYTGTLDGDAMKLTRQVGDIATEQITAQRSPAKS